MKNRLFILLLVSVYLFPANILAKRVTVKQAEKLALSFYFEHHPKKGELLFENIRATSVIKLNRLGHHYGYAFNIAQGGFVLTAANDAVFPVWGYAFAGSYDEENQPPAFTMWLNYYLDQAKEVAENNLSPGQQISQLWQYYLSASPVELRDAKMKTVEPMLTSAWDQGNHYNCMCPADPSGPGGHAYAGCVATAMGQVMYYFRWPESGTGSYTYNHPVYGEISANFENTEYQWEQMTNYLNRHNFAVGELLFHLGVSVDMDYGPNGSGMWNHKAAYSMRTYFKYSPETQYVYRDSTSMDWDSLLVSGLDQQIPMYYAGWSVPNVNGHAFVVDGYQSGNYYHFNWGWSGSFDGYFYTDQLNPGGSNFNLAQELIINAFPDTVNYSYPLYCNGDLTLTAKSGTLCDGSGPVYPYQNNMGCSWLISPQTPQDSITNIELTFDRFETFGPNDHLLVYDGGDAGAPLLGDYFGNSLPVEVISSGNEMFIEFITNNNGIAAGWFAEYRTTEPVWCSGLNTVTAASGSFDDGSGIFFYKNNSACMWLINTGNPSSVLTFNSINTEPDSDVIKVYDADSQELLGEYSGYYPPDSLPEPVYSPNFFVTFTSNSLINGPGWELQWEPHVGIGDETDGKILSLYPNPSHGQVNIALGDHISAYATISIMDVSGKILRIFEKKASSRGGHIKLDLSDLTNGIYLVRISAGGNDWWEKIVISSGGRMTY